MNENMRKIVERLEKHASPTPSKWREVFEYMDANETWLRYSQHIAMLMLDRMEELEMKPAVYFKGLERTGKPFA